MLVGNLRSRVDKTSSTALLEQQQLNDYTHDQLIFLRIHFADESFAGNFLGFVRYYAFGLSFLNSISAGIIHSSVFHLLLLGTAKQVIHHWLVFGVWGTLELIFFHRQSELLFTIAFWKIGLLIGQLFCFEV